MLLRVSRMVWTGLTCHQSRPFTMASCSRDSTVRLWSLTPLIAPLLLNIITDQPWEKITGNTGERGSVCFALKADLNLLLLLPCRLSDGSWIITVALRQSVSGHQAGAGQVELWHQDQEAALVFWVFFGNFCLISLISVIGIVSVSGLRLSVVYVLMTPRQINQAWILILWSDPADYASSSHNNIHVTGESVFFFEHFGLFFACAVQLQPPGGSINLWNLVSVINGQDDSLLPASYSKGVMHMKHLLKFKTVRTSFFTGPGEEAQISHSLVETHIHFISIHKFFSILHLDCLHVYTGPYIYTLPY